MKSFTQLVRETDRGRLLDDCEEALGNIIEAIEDIGGSGTITLKFKVRKKGDAFIVGGQVDHTQPKKERVDAMFFFDTEKGGLTQKDPRQPDLPHVVRGNFTKETIDEETGEVTNG